MTVINTDKKFGELLDHIINYNLEGIKVLIEEGVDVNAYEDDVKLRPLHFAAQCNFLSAIQLLIEAGADPLVKTIEGDTPLDIAKLHNHVRVIKMLEKFLGRDQ